MRRWVLIGALVAAALLWAPAAASAVTVKVIDQAANPGTTYTLDLGENADERDVIDTSYAIRSGSGTTPKEVDGFSLDQVFRLVGADRFSYTFLEVARSSGEPVTLSNQQVRESGSPDGPPVVYEDGGSVGFIRPSVGDGDKNAADAFSVPGELVITLKDGSPIEVSVSASRTEVDVGQEINFTAAITAPRTIDPEIRWNFGDGPSRRGLIYTIHTWKQPGTYRVVVSATDPATGQGPSAFVEVQVGEKKKGGPDRKGGGEDERDGAGDTGSSEGTGGSEDGTTTGPGTAPVSPVAPIAPVTPVTPTPEQPPEPEKPPRDPAPAGEEVSGELLEDAVVVAPEPVEQPEEKTKAETARTGTETTDGFGIPGAALGGMSVLALLGIGGLAQAGKIRPDSMMWHVNRLVGR